jgi:polar amino acid transport system permease protein
MLAARALGLSYLDAMREIVLPQAVRRMLPPLISQSVDVFKATALASTISVPELMYQTYYATSQTFRFVEFYTVSALVYFAISLPLISYVRRLELHVGV